MSKTKTPDAGLRQELVEVVLKKDHDHKGKPSRIGEPIKVTTDQRDWLARNGVIEQPEVIHE